MIVNTTKQFFGFHWFILQYIRVPQIMGQILASLQAGVYNFDSKLKIDWNELSFLIKSKIKSRTDDPPSIFFSLHPRLLVLIQRKNETLQSSHNYIPKACSGSLQLLEKLGLLFICLRSFIDLFEKSVLSKQIWGTELGYTFLTFIYLSFISCI